MKNPLALQLPNIARFLPDNFMQEDLLEIKGQSMLIGTALFILVIFVLAMLFIEQRDYMETKKALSAQTQAPRADN